MSTPAQAKTLAAQAVKTARIKPRGKTTPKQMEHAVAGAIAVTHPRSPHGRALMQALSGGTQENPRVRAIRWLVARGQVPTEAATAGRLNALEDHQATAAALRQAAQSAIATDGPRAAAVVAQVIAQTGAGPTWQELITAMGWPRQRHVRNYIVRGLSHAGWLAFTGQGRSLRPGPRAAKQAAAT